MNLFIIFSAACMAGIFTISQAYALISIFDFYFYLMPFGLALAGFFLIAGVMHLSTIKKIDGDKLKLIPAFSGFLMLLSVITYLLSPRLGPSAFILSLIAAQFVAYMSIWVIIIRNARPIRSATGIATGLILGYVLIAYLNMDPLMVILVMSGYSISLSFVQFLKKLRPVAYLFIVCLAAFILIQGRQHCVMPAKLGWLLDIGKATPINIGISKGQGTWGPAGWTEAYALNSEGHDAWLYTNASSPALVLEEKPVHYGNAWWAEKAPLTMALYDALQPKSIVDVGMSPGEMVWRAMGRGERENFGLYGSDDWAKLQMPGIESIRKSVTFLRHPILSANGNLPSSVDMVVLSSSNAGTEGWISSNAGEQAFLDRGNLLSYWKSLTPNGALILFSRQQSVFFRHIFSIWAALKSTGMSDQEFLDHAWGVIPDTEVFGSSLMRVFDSPYQYALVITKKNRDENFAKAIREEVSKLPVRYLFGFAIQPSRPYDYFYKFPMDKIRALFTQGISGMVGAQMSLEPPDSQKSTPYQFVQDVYPELKKLLVMSVCILIGIVLFAQPEHRRIEQLKTQLTPGVAVVLAMGAASGILMVLALVYLLVLPENLPQEHRLLLFSILLPGTALINGYEEILSIRKLISPLLGVASVLLLALCLITNFMPLFMDTSILSIGAAGVILILSWTSLPILQTNLIRESGSEMAGWWWVAMSAGVATMLFWFMRLYALIGNGLLLVASLLMLGIASIFWWYRATESQDVQTQDQAEATPLI